MNSTLQKIYERYGASLSADEEAELWTTAAHEIGHSWVARHYNLDPAELVLATNGVCVYRAGNSLANSAVGWGGIFSEILLGATRKNLVLPATSLTKSTLRNFVDTFNRRQLSIEDQRGIESHHSIYDSAHSAFDIISGDLDVVEYFAKRLASEARDEFIESTFRSSAENEKIIQKFVHQKREVHASEDMDKRLQRAVIEGEQILANLPPCSVPEEFNIETFKAATGASDADIREFCAFRVLRERNQVGLGGAPTAAVETAVKFFHESSVETRDSWICQAREFCAWRNDQQQKHLNRKEI